MVDWNDPTMLAKCGLAEMQLSYAVLGLYGWDYVRSSHIEVTLLRRQLKFRWPLVPYVAGRFSFLLAITTVAIRLSPFYTTFHCQGIIMASMFSNNIAVGCSATNLMIRTWIIWNTSYVVRILLVLLCLGQWIVLSIFVATIHASLQEGVCMIDHINPIYASAAPMYNMVFDSLLLTFTIVGLWRMQSSSALWKILVKQGVMYFIINLIANTILLVLRCLNLNAIMNTIFGIPAGCMCTLASSQVVRSLLRPSQNDDSISSSLVKEAALTDQVAVPAESLLLQY